MAKIKNKIVSNRLKKQNVKQAEIFKDLKLQMQEMMEAEDYVAAMDVMAEIAANKKIDGEVMYWGAMCYFRTGDYERAAKWINDALYFGGAGSRERILLAGICIAEGRYEDSMRIIEAVLADENETVSGSDREFMQEIMKPISYGYDAVLSEYPRVMALVQEGEKIASGQPEDRRAKDKASTAIAKLKALLHKNKSDNKLENAAGEAKAVVEDSKPTGSEAESVTMVEKNVLEGGMKTTETDVVVDSFDTEGTMQQIMTSAVSLQAKVRMLNAFAAGCYQSGNYQAAFDLLNGALQLDAYAPEVLKNMAYVCLAAGEKEQALEYAAKLPMADFGLLHALKCS